MFLRRLAAVIAVIAVGWLTPAIAQADTAPDVYATPGVHLVNGRYWQTTCSHYSGTVVRCTTNIYATKVVREGNAWYKQNTWVFNNLSYLPSPREQWAGNPLATTGSWTSADGRKWRSECDTAATGRGACRNYILATVASEKGGVVTQKSMEIFNSVVRFSTGNVKPVTSIPAAAPARSDVPAPGPKVLLTPAKPAPAPAKPAPAPAPAKPAPSKPSSVAGSGYNCPSGYPVKGNQNSKGEWIYHVPGGAFYERTAPEECFVNAAAAKAAGYRASQR